MDVERPVREQLLQTLNWSFLSHEEVELSHPFWPELNLRADIVAVPLDDPLRYLPLAFEVKNPAVGDESKYTTWSFAIKQAADYVFASIRDPRMPDFNGRRIAGAFVFPAPNLPPPSPDKVNDRETYHRTISAGAFHLAQHFGVGRALLSANGELLLMFGPSVVFAANSWSDRVKRVLKSKRRIGSQMIDIHSRLGGLNEDFAPYETD